MGGPKLFAVSVGGRGRNEPFGDSLLCILYYATDAGFGDAVGGRQLHQAHAAGSVTEKSAAVDDQVAFQLGDRTDDDDQGAAERPGGVDVLAEADELNIEPVEFVEHLEEVLDRACHAIEGPDQDDVEAAAAGIMHQLIKPGTLRLCAADFVRVLPDDLETALRGQAAQVVELGLGMLINGRDPHV